MSGFWKGFWEGLFITVAIGALFILKAQREQINTLSASMNSLEANMAALDNEVGAGQ